MDAKTLLEQNGTATVSDLVALGESRHTARHQLEDLVAKGVALKTTEGKKVSYSRIISGDAMLAAIEPPIAITDRLVLPPGLTVLGVPEDAAPILPHLRATKALSVALIVRRSGLPATTVRASLKAAVACGLAIKPFRRSDRYQRAC